MKLRFPIWTNCELYFFHPKNPGPTYQDGISRIKNRGNECWAQEISWANDSDSYSMWKLQGWIRKRTEFIGVDQGKPMLDFQLVFLPLSFCKHFKGFCRNQILSKLYGSVSIFLEFLGLENESGNFRSMDY